MFDYIKIQKRRDAWLRRIYFLSVFIFMSPWLISMAWSFAKPLSISLGIIEAQAVEPSPKKEDQQKQKKIRRTRKETFRVRQSKSRRKGGLPKYEEARYQGRSSYPTTVKKDPLDFVKNIKSMKEWKSHIAGLPPSNGEASKIKFRFSGFPKNEQEIKTIEKTYDLNYIYYVENAPFVSLIKRNGEQQLLFDPKACYRATRRWHHPNSVDSNNRYFKKIKASAFSKLSREAAKGTSWSLWKDAKTKPKKLVWGSALLDNVYLESAKKTLESANQKNRGLKMKDIDSINLTYQKNLKGVFVILPKSYESNGKKFTL